MFYHVLVVPILLNMSWCMITVDCPRVQSSVHCSSCKKQVNTPKHLTTQTATRLRPAGVSATGSASSPAPAWSKMLNPDETWRILANQTWIHDYSILMYIIYIYSHVLSCFGSTHSIKHELMHDYSWLSTCSKFRTLSLKKKVNTPKHLTTQTATGFRLLHVCVSCCFQVLLEAEPFLGHFLP